MSEGGKTVNTGGGTYVDGDVKTGRDFIGRDQINAHVEKGGRLIIQHIQRPSERDLSLEVKDKDEARERRVLADAVTAYIDRLSRIGETPQTSKLPQSSNPYKALLEYDLQDASVFFGRDAEIQKLLDRLGRGRLTVLYSESGSGKTSLLKAGLMPRLLAAGQAPIYLRPYTKPVPQVLKSELISDSYWRDLPKLAGASLHDFLRQVTDILGKQPVVVIIDQFEELFTLQDTKEREEFITQLAPCLEDTHLPVRWVFSVRGEWYSQLGTFSPRIGNPFANWISLEAFNRVDAEAAILQPANERKITFEKGLIKILLNDLDEDGIAPPQMQLVCSTLADELKGDTVITVAMYERLGGTEGILRGHLSRVLETIPANRRRAARRLLDALVSSKTRRVLRLREELIAEVAKEGFASELLGQILDQLVVRRLLRVTAEGEGKEVRAYELAHDYLLGEIEIDPERQARKAARELIEKKLPYYLSAERLLLSAGELAIVNPHRNQLGLTGKAASLVRDSNRRQNVTRFSAIGVVVLFILAIFLLQAQATSKQTRIAATAQAAEAEALVKGTEAAEAKETAQIDRDIAETEANLRAIAEAEAVAERDLARAGELAAQALFHMEDQHDLAMLLSIEANAITQTLQTRQALYTIWQHNPRLTQMLHTNSRVCHTDFSLNLKTLASASCDGYILLWDGETHQPLGELHLEEHGWVGTVAFSQNGQTLASGSQDGTITLWDAETFKQIGDPLLEHNSTVNSVAFSPDGQSLASGDEDGSIFLWDVQTQQPLGEPLREHNDVVFRVAFSTDGDTLASGSMDGTIILWDVQTRQPIGDPLTHNGSSVRSVVFSPDGRTLAAGYDDSSIILWDVRRREQLGEPLRGHGNVVEHVVFSPDGQTLASGSWDSSIRLWDVRSRVQLGEPLRGHDSGVHSLAFNRAGDTLASGSSDDTIIFWDITDREQLGKLFESAEDPRSVRSVAFSPDGNTLASGLDDYDWAILLWDVQSREPLGDPLKGHAFTISSVAFSPDGRTLASGAAADGDIILWDVETLEPLGEPLHSDDSWPKTLAFSPDGDILAAGYNNSDILLWDVKTRQPNGDPLGEHNSPVNSVAFSPDGQTLASGSEEGVLLWDVQTQQPLGEPLGGKNLNALSVVFSPNGNTLVVGTSDDTIIFWDVQTQQSLGEPLRVNNGWIYSVVYSLDGHTLASSAYDGLIHLWDAHTLQLLGEPLRGPAFTVYSLAFNPDGYLASGSGGGTILWDAAPNLWIKTSCQRVGRNLTEAEWSQFLSWKDYDPNYKTCPQWP